MPTSVTRRCLPAWLLVAVVAVVLPTTAGAAPAPAPGAKVAVGAIGTSGAYRITTTLSNPRRTALAARVAIRAGAEGSATRIVCPTVRKVLRARGSASVSCTWRPVARSSGMWRVELLVASGASTRFAVRGVRSVFVARPGTGTDDGDEDDGSSGDGGTDDEPGVDVDPPTLAISDVPAAPTAPFTVTVDAQDASEVAWVSLAVDAGLAQFDRGEPFVFTVDPSKLPDGEHELTVAAADSGGRTSTLSRRFTTGDPHADVTPPVLTLHRVPTAPVNATFFVNAAATDDSGAEPRVTFQLDGGERRVVAAPWAYFVDLARVPDGAHALEVVATDAAGNAATASATFTTDATPPTLVVDASTVPASRTNVPFTVTATAGDAVGLGGVDFRVDDGPVVTVTRAPFAYAVVPAVIPSGEHELVVTARDAAGNVRSRTVGFTTDVTPPTVNIVSGPAEGSTTTSTGASFAVSRTEGGGPMSCRIDAVAWAVCTSPVPYSNLVVGTHTFSVRAADALGNVSAVVTRSWTVVAPPPPPPPPPPALPDGSNTGVPAGTDLTVVRGNQTVPGTNLTTAANGDLTITTPGVTIDAIDLYGYVIVKAANVTIRRSRIRGSGPATDNWGMVVARDRAVSNLVLEDLTLVPDHPTYWVDGVVGHDFTARRINTYNVVDGFGVFNTTGPNANVVIESSYMHDFAFFYPDEDHSDGTHNDGVEVQGGAHVQILNNNIQAFVSPTVGTLSGPFRIRQAAQGILYVQNVNAISDGVIRGNLVDGAKAGIKMIHNGSSGLPTMDAGVIAENRLGRDQYDYGNGSKYPIRIVSKTAITVTGLATNVWADTGVALAEGRNLGIRYE